MQPRSAPALLAALFCCLSPGCRRGARPSPPDRRVRPEATGARPAARRPGAALPRHDARRDRGEPGAPQGGGGHHRLRPRLPEPRRPAAVLRRARHRRGRRLLPDRRRARGRRQPRRRQRRLPPPRPLGLRLDDDARLRLAPRGAPRPGRPALRQRRRHGAALGAAEHLPPRRAPAPRRGLPRPGARRHRRRALPGRPGAQGRRGVLPRGDRGLPGGGRAGGLARRCSSTAPPAPTRPRSSRRLSTARRSGRGPPGRTGRSSTWRRS